MPGDQASVARDVNESGAVVGYSESLDAQGHAHMRSFLYVGGKMTPLGSLAADNTAVAVNNAGAVLGYSSTWGPHGTTYFPYLYQDGVQYDLASLVVNPAGWRVAGAADINDSGMIVGQACNAGGCHAALLTPVPEPAAYAMLLAGLGWLGWRKLSCARAARG